MTKMITGNHRFLKNLNRNVILNLIRTNAPISGARLAKITGMRPSTVQNILKNLEQKGLVFKIGTGDSTKLGGRRPTLWKICGNYGYVVGIQLEINEITAILVDFNSQLIDERRTIVEKFNTLSDIEDNVIKIIKNMLDSRGIGKNLLLGVGIGVSGLVDISNGAIIRTSLLSPSQQPIYLEKSLKKYFNIPIYIENDANAAALAEKWFGKAKGIHNIIFTLAVVDRDVFGIGFGLILKNDIYRGANMFAGETNPFDLNIKKILRHHCNYQEQHLTVDDQLVKLDELQIHQLIKALDHGDEIAIHFFQEIASILADELLTIINLLDPNMIVIGGEISKAKEYLLSPLRKIIHEKNLFKNRKLQIVESLFPANSVALGAATIILRKLFQEPKIEAI